ncbi:hypothetical protein PG988_004400 [Apiospora saccharicola]
MHAFTVALLAMGASAVTARGIVYDCSKTPQICLNTCWAINCAGLPADLHGGGNKDAKASKKKGDANRNAWGYGSKPCDPTKGSKYWKNGNGAGKPVQLRCVPTSEQKEQSGKVSGLGTAKTSAVWTTRWTNIQNLPQNWCGANPTCVNDGHQFTATAKGVFTRSLDIGAADVPVFEDAVYEGNSTTITVRTDEEADFDIDDVPDVEEEEEGAGVEARGDKVGVAFWG